MVKISVVGSGSVFSPELVVEFAGVADRMGGVLLRFMDIDGPRQVVVSDFCRRLLGEQPVEIVDCASLEDCIDGADFVLLQLRQGGIDARIEDELLGKKYMLPFTETISICGMSTFLRTYFEYEKLAADIKKYAPDAWVLNFTNPAGQLSETLYAFGLRKVIGVCNGFMGQKEQIEKALNIDDGSYTMNWRGLNHLTIVDGIYHEGKNRIADVLETLPDGDMQKDLGALLNGYFQYYFDRVNVIDRLQKQEKVRSELVKEIDIKLLEEYKNAKEIPESLNLRGGYGYSTAVVNIIRAICLDEGSMHYAVVKNGSCLPSLPEDAFVEVPIIVNKSGAFPVVNGDLPGYAKVLAIAVKTYERILI